MAAGIWKSINFSEVLQWSLVPWGTKSAESCSIAIIVRPLRMRHDTEHQKTDEQYINLTLLKLQAIYSLAK